MAETGRPARDVVRRITAACSCPGLLHWRPHRVRRRTSGAGPKPHGRDLTVVRNLGKIHRLHHRDGVLALVDVEGVLTWSRREVLRPRAALGARHPFDVHDEPDELLPLADHLRIPYAEVGDAVVQDEDRREHTACLTLLRGVGGFLHPPEAAREEKVA